MSPRVAAVRALLRLFADGRSLQDALDRVLARIPDARDRALCQEICYGVARWYRRLDAVAARLLDRPLRRRDEDVRLLLLTGLYQLLAGFPAHAAVSETAGAGRELGKPWAVRLLNALLRRYQREAEALLADVDRHPGLRLSCPDWLLARLRADWPEDWEAVAAAGNTHPPMVLRVNARRTDRTAYARRLAEAGLPGRPVPGAPAALRLDSPVPVERLPGFAAGDVSVQDAAAQLAAPLLDVRRNARVLDACAAPGGKTGHLLELAGPGVVVVAVDRDRDRLARVAGNLDRLGLAATLVQGDAAVPGDWWDGEPFDRILLDAPCSGTGVIRRHPDIKWLRREGDPAALAAEQQRLLQGLWPLLARGGRLVYVTCSVLREENDAVVEAFLQRTADAGVVPVDLTVGRVSGAGWQVLPGEQGMDGFFYTCLEKG